MKITPFIQFTFAIVAISFLGIGCNQSSRESDRLGIASKSLAPESPSESKAPSQTDVTKMQREAALQFRVKDVIKTTGVLEKMTVRHGGYVAKSYYDIEESESLIKKLSTDSAQEIKKLDQRNHMEVFVLNTNLDSFLNQISPLVDHLNYRHLSANDEPMEDAHSNSSNYLNSTATDKKTVIQNDATEAYQKRVSNTLKSKFARVTMDIYQTPVIKKWTIPNPDSFEVARGGFWEDFVSSVKQGWRGVSIFFNYIVSIWPLFLLAAGFMGYARKRNKTWNPLSLLRKK